MQPRATRGEAAGWSLFNAEAAYADSIVRSAMGDVRGSIEALRRSHAALPSFAPAILSLGSVEFQRQRSAEGRRLFLSLLDLPDDTQDLVDIIDKAGDFLIQSGKHADGIEIFQRAAARFPRVAAFQQGIGCCAGHLGRHDEAIAASRAALDIEPENQKLVNDLGWALYGAGCPDGAQRVLEQAVAMDPNDALAAENLRICRSASNTRGSSARHRRRSDG